MVKITPIYHCIVDCAISCSTKEMGYYSLQGDDAFFTRSCGSSATARN